MIVLSIGSAMPIVVGIFIIATLAFLGFRFYIERKKDRAEIDDIVASLIEAKPRREVEEGPALEKKSNIEEVLAKMQDDLNTKPEDVVATFEQEQEDKSIISYQELVRTLNSKTEPQKMVSEFIAEEPPVSERERYASKKFRNTDFISPVYGKLEDHLEYPTVPSFEKKEQVRFDFTKDNHELEDTLEELKEKEKSIHDYLSDFRSNIEIDNLAKTIAPVSNELKESDEFLEALKEFRKNLD